MVKGRRRLAVVVVVVVRLLVEGIDDGDGTSAEMMRVEVEWW